MLTSSPIYSRARQQPESHTNGTFVLAQEGELLGSLLDAVLVWNQRLFESQQELLLHLNNSAIIIGDLLLIKVPAQASSIQSPGEFWGIQGGHKI